MTTINVIFKLKKNHVVPSLVKSCDHITGQLYNGRIEKANLNALKRHPSIDSASESDRMSQTQEA